MERELVNASVKVYKVLVYDLSGAIGVVTGIGASCRVDFRGDEGVESGGVSIMLAIMK